MSETTTSQQLSNGGARKAWLAKMMTHLAPGLGHLYCGQVLRGLTIYFGGGLLLPLILLAIMLGPQGASWFLLGALLVGAAIWLFAAHDIKRVLKRTEEEFEPPSHDRWWLYLLIAVQPLGYIIPASLLVREHLLEAFIIAGDSMSPALLKRDRVLVDKRHAGDGVPSRGDVVVFRCPGERNKNFVKRIVGLPGETLRTDAAGRVFIDGVATEHSGVGNGEGESEIELVKESLNGVHYVVKLGEEQETFEMTIPRDHVFVLGDNRGKSRDSRHFGVVHVGDVQGPVTFIYQPVGGWGRMGSFSPTMP